MVVLVVLVFFVAGFGNRQEVNYKLTIVNTINCNILFHSVVFFLFILLAAYKQFVGEFWLRVFVVNNVKLSLLLWQWNQKYNTKDFNKMNFVHLEKFWKQESIIIFSFNIIYVSRRYHLSYCILSIRVFYLKIEFLCLNFYHPFFCNLQLLIYISHSVSVCVCVCCASMSLCVCFSL